MKMNSLAAIALCLVLQQPTLAEEVEARMDVKGIQLGASLAEAKALAKLTCSKDATGRFDTVCGYANSRDSTFAGHIAGAAIFGFFSDKLDSVEFNMAGGAYASVKSALDGKFGEATPAPGLEGLSMYRMNGDRGYVMYAEGHRTLVFFQAATGVAERERRTDIAKAKLRKDM